MTKTRTIITTAALPYANNDLHLGHMLEHVMVDIRNRFFKMRGIRSLFICGDDTHGTAIMISAGKAGMPPEQWIEKIAKQHLADFSGFQIEFDHYSSTNTPANREMSYAVYEKLKLNGHLQQKNQDQFYCEHDKMFLPDRFVKGSCPRCGTLDQYGDNCESCGASYSSFELKAPYCTLCRNTPVIKQSQHLFFDLTWARDYLKTWVEKHTAPEIGNKLKEWLNGELKDWCISRDAPYFGFEIPGLKDKYFYVWLDAPLGYLSATKEWCEKNGENFEQLWASPDTSVYHCVGKDIAYFHCLFFPALLKSADLRSANHVFVHGFLTVNDAKMSKSRGTMISVNTYLKHLDSAYLRYYFACKINSSQDDLSFTVDDFVNRVNADLIGKITNVASRGAQMLTKKLDGIIGDLDAEGLELVKSAQAYAEEIAGYYENMEYAKALIKIRSIADSANLYFDQKKPWLMLKESIEATRVPLSVSLNLFRIMAIYLKPVLPEYAKKVEALFNEEPYSWEAAQTILKSHKINDYEHLLGRIELEKVEAMIADQESQKAAKTEKTVPVKSKETVATKEIEFNDFAKVDLRVGEITQASAVEGSDKLLKLQVSFGALGERTIFSGIKASYSPESLLAKKAIFVFNLKPRKMRFGISEGMLLCAGEDPNLSILTPSNAAAKPGDQVS